MKTFNLTWEQIDRGLERLVPCLPLCKEKTWDILCVARGGLCVAGILSHKIETRSILTVTLESYSVDNVRTEIKLRNDVPTMHSTRPYLLVDDIVDSGETVKFLLERLLTPPKAIVTCVRKNASAKEFQFREPWNKEPIPVCASYEVEPDMWVCFPWEPKR